MSATTASLACRPSPHGQAKGREHKRSRWWRFSWCRPTGSGRHSTHLIVGVSSMYVEQLVLSLPRSATFTSGRRKTCSGLPGTAQRSTLHIHTYPLAYPTFPLTQHVARRPEPNRVSRPLHTRQSGSQRRPLGAGVGVLGRRRPGVTDHFEAALSGSGSGPRRARTRNVAPRYTARSLRTRATRADARRVKYSIAVSYCQWE